MNSKEVILESLSRKIVLFSTSETNAIVAVNISIITERIRIPGTIRSKSDIFEEVPIPVSDILNKIS